MVNIKKKKKEVKDDSAPLEELSEELEWILEVVNEASALINNEFSDSSHSKTRPRIDNISAPEQVKEFGWVESTREIEVPASFYMPQHPDEFKTLEESTDPYCDSSREKVMEFISDFKSVHDSGVSFNTKENENRAISFHTQWYNEAVSFCAFRFHEGQWCEVIKPWSNARKPGVDSHAWSLISPILCQDQSSAQPPSSLMIRHHSDLFVVVYEHPYVCVHQHNMYSRVRLLRALRKFELTL